MRRKRGSSRVGTVALGRRRAPPTLPSATTHPTCDHTTPCQHSTTHTRHQWRQPHTHQCSTLVLPSKFSGIRLSRVIVSDSSFRSGYSFKFRGRMPFIRRDNWWQFYLSWWKHDTYLVCWFDSKLEFVESCNKRLQKNDKECRSYVELGQHELRCAKDWGSHRYDVSNALLCVSFVVVLDCHWSIGANPRQSERTVHLWNNVASNLQ